MKFNNNNEQLKNSVIKPKLDNYEYNNFDIKVSDYRSLDVTRVLKTDFTDFTMSQTSPQNMLIENFAFNIYKDPKFFDILLLINKRDMMFDMSYDYDTLIDLANEIATNYFSDYIGAMPEELFELFRDNILDYINEKNTSFSTFRIVPKNRIAEFQRVMESEIIKED